MEGHLVGSAPPEVLDALVGEVLRVLGDQVAGVYLYGSLVTGDFDPQVSDVDLLVVTQDALSDAHAQALHRMHDAIAGRYLTWAGRIEVAYVPRELLKNFRTVPSQIAVISPGEPFHFKDAGRDWLMNWWLVRQGGHVLHGPAPETLIDPISTDEFITAVVEHAAAWREWVTQMRARGAQAYVVLTMCRALFACAHRRQASKLQAARWAMNRFPEWAGLASRALRWRTERDHHALDGDDTLAETAEFVEFTNRQLPELVGAPARPDPITRSSR